MSAAEILSALDRIHGTVSVIGSMNADYTVTAQRLPGPGETITGGPLQLLPGGKSGNQAAAAARIGATVQMFGAVGSDDNADFLLGALGEAGVNTTHVRRVLGPSGTTVITVDAHGENTIVYSPGSNAQVTVDYVESVRDALTHSTVLGLCLESPIETVTAAARMCHEAGVKVLLNDSPFTPSLPAELIEASDILLVNEHEMAQLLGIDEPENDDWDSFGWWHALDELRGFGFEQAIVTLGGDGSVVLDGTADESGTSRPAHRPGTRQGRRHHRLRRFLHGHRAGRSGVRTGAVRIRRTRFVRFGVRGHRLRRAGVLRQRGADPRGVRVCRIVR